MKKLSDIMGELEKGRPITAEAILVMCLHIGNLENKVKNLEAERNGRIVDETSL